MYDICISTCMCIRVYNCEIANIFFRNVSSHVILKYFLHFNTHVFMFCTQQLFNISPTFLNTWVKELQRRIKKYQMTVWITTYRGIDFPYNTWVWRVYTSWLYLYFPRVYGTTCMQRQPPSSAFYKWRTPS